MNGRIVLISSAGALVLLHGAKALEAEGNELAQELRLTVRTDIRDDGPPQRTIEVHADDEHWKFMVDDHREGGLSGVLTTIRHTADGKIQLGKALNKGTQIRSRAPLPEHISAMVVFESEAGSWLLLVDGRANGQLVYVPVLMVGCQACVQGGTCCCNADGPHAKCVSGVQQATCTDGAHAVACSGSAECSCVTTAAEE